MPLIEQGGSRLCLPCFSETYRGEGIAVTPETLREVQEAVGHPVSMADIALLMAQWRRQAG